MRGRQWLITGLAAGLLAGCVCASLSLGALQFAPQIGGPLPIGYTVLACGNVTSTPRLQVNVSWIIPQVMSSIIPTPPWSRGCVYAPWLPALPPSGYWRIPP